MFALCAIPAFASETLAPVNQTAEQTTPQPTKTPDILDEPQCSDQVAINNDLKKVVIIASVVALTWALIYTYKNLLHTQAKIVDAKEHIAELEGIKLAEFLVNSEKNLSTIFSEFIVNIKNHLQK